MTAEGDKQRFAAKCLLAVWSSKKAHMADALASGGDEGRANLRKAEGSR